MSFYIQMLASYFRKFNQCIFTKNFSFFLFLPTVIITELQSRKCICHMCNYSQASTQRVTSGLGCKTDLKTQDLRIEAIWQLSPTTTRHAKQVCQLSPERRSFTFSSTAANGQNQTQCAGYSVLLFLNKLWEALQTYKKYNICAAK